MRDLAAAQPLVEGSGEISVSEFLAPNGGERLPSFDERAVEIEQPHQPWPLARPVGDSENRPLVAAQSGQDVVAVLPGGCSKNQPLLGMYLHEDIHPGPLRGNEAVLEGGVIGVSANQLDSLLRKGRGQLLFHVALRRPADLVGREAQVSAGNE